MPSHHKAAQSLSAFQRDPRIAIISTLVIGMLGLILIFSSIAQSNEDLIRVQERFHRVQSLHGDVMLIDEKLTMSCWVAATTLDRYWGQRYNQYVVILESKLSELMEIAPAPTRPFIQETIDSNKILVRREDMALKAADKGESKTAIEYLTHPEYSEHKRGYSEGMSQLNTRLEQYFQERITTERKQIKRRELLILIVAFALIVFWVFVYRIASRWHNLISNSLVTSNRLEASLRQNVATHKLLVQERTVEIQSLRHALLQAERQERQRLRRFVHDDLQQLIVAMRLKSAMYRDHSEEPTHRDQYQELVTLSNGALISARDLVMRLSTPEEQQHSLQEMLSALATQFQKRYQLVITIDQSSFVEPTQFEVRLLVFRAIRELLFNIVKYAQTDKAQVELRSERDHDIIVVRDQGIGFDIDSLPINSQHIQSGLGLLGMREQFALVGGTVDVTSQPTVGTVITLSIPHGNLISIGEHRSEELHQSLESVEHTTAGGESTPNKALGSSDESYTLFIIDDNFALRQMIVQLFQSTPQFKVIGQAKSGPEAVELSTQREVDLILIDYSLPGIDGAETLKKITALRPYQKAIGFTSFDLPEIIQSFEEAGAARVILKGGDPEQLIESCLQVVKS